MLLTQNKTSNENLFDIFYDMKVIAIAICISVYHGLYIVKLHSFSNPTYSGAQKTL